jgi:hypothetical protein|tara:strand:+ start:2906 stop:4786 length:1881 start_codon:yes stop_codon:yes gene_type:complete
MAPGQYETPLADFLDRLPGLVNQYQQNKLAQQRQDLADKRYEDQIRYRDRQERRAIERQRIDDLKYIQGQRNQELARADAELKFQEEKAREDFKDHLEIANSFDKPVQKAQYIENVIKKDKRFKRFDLKPIENQLAVSKKLDNNYDELMSRYEDLIQTNRMEQFRKYESIDTLFTEMKGMLPEYRGTQYEKEFFDKYGTIADLRKELQQKSGQVTSFDDAPFNVKNKYKQLNELQKITGKAFREAESKLNEIADYDPAKQKFELIDDLKGTQLNEDDFIKRQRTYNLAKKRLDQTQARLASFIDDNNLRYPEIITAEKRESMDAMTKEMTDWFAENQSYLLSKSKDGGVLAEMLYDDLSGVDRYDRYQMLKGLVEQEKEFDQMFADLDIDEESEPFEQGARMTTGANFEPGQITSQDVDDVLADVRRTTGFFPEGDAPRDVEEPQIEPSPQVPSAPVTTAQLQARPDSETERVIRERQEDARNAELFPSADFDSLEEADIKDDKGKEVSFSSPQRYNSQINNMYKKAESTAKKVKRLNDKKDLLGGVLGAKDSAELARLEKEGDSLVSSLVNSLSVLNASVDQSVGSTTNQQKNQRRIISTAKNFLKNKKFSNVFQLQKYFEDLSN